MKKIFILVALFLLTLLTSCTFEEEITIVQEQHEVDDIMINYQINRSSTKSKETVGSKTVYTFEYTFDLSDIYDGCDITATIILDSSSERLASKEINITTTDEVTNTLTYEVNSTNSDYLTLFEAFLSYGTINIDGYAYYEREVTNDPTELESFTLSTLDQTLIDIADDYNFVIFDLENYELILDRFSSIPIEEIDLEIDFETQVVLVVIRNYIPATDVKIDYSGLHFYDENVSINYTIIPDSSQNKLQEVFAMDFIVIDKTYYNEVNGYDYFFNELNE